MNISIKINYNISLKLARFNIEKRIAVLSYTMPIFPKIFDILMYYTYKYVIYITKYIQLSNLLEFT